jgi:hypothetical protein
LAALLLSAQQRRGGRVTRTVGWLLLSCPVSVMFLAAVVVHTAHPEAVY